MTLAVAVADLKPSLDLWHVRAKIWRVLIFSDSIYRERMVMGYYKFVNGRALRLS